METILPFLLLKLVLCGCGLKLVIRLRLADLCEDVTDLSGCVRDLEYPIKLSDQVFNRTSAASY
jgi:hypothetical protein